MSAKNLVHTRKKLLKGSGLAMKEDLTFGNKNLRARQKSWRKFADEELGKNPWGIIYKLAPEKFHQASTLTPLTPQEEAMTHIVETLFSDDNPLKTTMSNKWNRETTTT